MKKTFEIKLQGQKIVLRSTEEDPALLKQVVELVQGKLAEAEKRSVKSAAPHQITLVALLELAQEYVQARNRTAEFKRQVQAKTRQLDSLLDAR